MSKLWGRDIDVCERRKGHAWASIIKEGKRTKTETSLFWSTNHIYD